LLLGVLWLPAGPAAAAEPMAGWAAASDEELQALRGGYDLGNGLVVQLSIDRTIMVNGETRLSESFRLPENFSLQRIRDSLGNPGSAAAADLAGLSQAPAVIQNVLDNQLISHSTVMNITLSNVRNLLVSGPSVIHPVMDMDSALLR
jgi:hypothetical protein